MDGNFELVTLIGLLRFVLFDVVLDFSGFAAIVVESVEALRARQFELLAGIGIFVVGFFAALPFFFQLRNQPGNFFDAPPTVVGDSLFEVALLFVILVYRRLLLLRIIFHPKNFEIEPGNHFFQQPVLALCNPGSECFPQPLRFNHAGDQQLVTAAVVHQRCESGDLPFGFDDGLVCGVEVVEQAAQSGDAWLDVRVFQHVVAHEFGDVGYGFHRHGLVEQIQRLFTRQAHAAAEVFAVFGEAVVQRDSRHFAQPFFEFLNVFTEAGKIPCNGKFAFGYQVKTLRLPLVILHPEHLGQRHGFVEMLVAKTAQNHRIAPQPAQGHGFSGQAFIIFFALVIAAHIRSQAAFTRFGAGCFVEHHPMRGNQQRGNRIHQRGFSRADVACQQGIFTIGTDAPDALVKRAPVEHLKVVEAKTRRFK